MRDSLLIPILVLAALAAFSLVARSSEPVALVAVTPGQVAFQAYILPQVQVNVTTPTPVPVPPRLDANVALLYDLDTQQLLYEHNATTQVPIASLTKLLSALVVQDLFDQGEVVTVASSSVRVDGQIQTLYVGERILVRDLVSMMLVESSNDAAYALAAYARERQVDFVGEMNRKAFVLGMNGCVFTDPAGLDDQAYCTAHDLLGLVRAALTQAPGLWPVMATPELTVKSADGQLTHRIKSTNELLGQVPGIIGGKTGYTEGALGCLILVVKLPGKNATLVSVVLGSRVRFGDTQILLAWANSLK